MSDVKRYDLDRDACDVVETDSCGEYVLATDHDKRMVTMDDLARHLTTERDALKAERDLLLAYKDAVGDNRLCTCEPKLGGPACPPCRAWDAIDEWQRAQGGGQDD